MTVAMTTPNQLPSICTTGKHPVVVTGFLTSYRQSGVDVPPPAAMGTGVTDDNQKCNRKRELRDAEVILEFGIIEDAHDRPKDELEIKEPLA